MKLGEFFQDNWNYKTENVLPSIEIHHSSIQKLDFNLIK